LELATSAGEFADAHACVLRGGAQASLGGFDVDAPARGEDAYCGVDGDRFADAAWCFLGGAAGHEREVCVGNGSRGPRAEEVGQFFVASNERAR
jgi:hypothetical protein